MSMGGAMDGGGNEHKDKEDQREGTEDSSGADDNLVSVFRILLMPGPSLLFQVGDHVHEVEERRAQQQQILQF